MKQAIGFVHSLKIDNRRRKKKRNTKNPLFICHCDRTCLMHMNALTGHYSLNTVSLWTLLNKVQHIEYSVPTSGCTPFAMPFYRFTHPLTLFIAIALYFIHPIMHPTLRNYIWSAEELLQSLFHRILFTLYVQWRHRLRQFSQPSNGQYIRQVYNGQCMRMWNAMKMCVKL